MGPLRRGFLRPLVGLSSVPRVVRSLTSASSAQTGHAKREISTLQAKKVAGTFFRATKKTWDSMYDRGNPLGRRVWSNPKAAEILGAVNKTITEGDGHKGIIGWHATTTPEEILEQARSHPEGRLEERANAHDEGLYLGTPENAVHFTGGSVAFRVASTNRLGQNDDYGTGTVFLRPGTGETYCLEAREIRDEFKEFAVPYIQKAVIQSLISGVKAAVELYKKLKE